MRSSVALLIAVLAVVPATGEAKGARGPGGRSGGVASGSSGGSGAASAGAGRSSGSGFREIERELQFGFQRTHACPSTGKTYGNCPGYVVGYVLLPKHGGTYRESNMRWMTAEEAEQSGQQWR